MTAPWRTNRLPVEMHVEQHRARTRHLAAEFGEHQRLAVVGKLPGGEAALAERLFEPLRIAHDIGGIDRIVG